MWTAACQTTEHFVEHALWLDPSDRSTDQETTSTEVAPDARGMLLVGTATSGTYSQMLAAE